MIDNTMVTKSDSDRNLVDQPQTQVDGPVNQPYSSVDGQRCWTCGSPLAASPTRPRMTCGGGCQQRRGFVLRQIKRRRAWVASWHEAALYRQVVRSEAARMIADIESDIELLKTPLWQRAVQAQEAETAEPREGHF